VGKSKTERAAEVVARWTIAVAIREEVRRSKESVRPRGKQADIHQDIRNFRKGPFGTLSRLTETRRFA
jgi:hypothetical protein